jgi:hypothetical protein
LLLEHALPGFQSIAMRVALGRISRMMSICLPIAAVDSAEVPVTLPPGPRQVADDPGGDRIADGHHHDRTGARRTTGRDRRARTSER